MMSLGLGPVFFFFAFSRGARALPGGRVFFFFFGLMFVLNRRRSPEWATKPLQKRDPSPRRIRRLVERLADLAGATPQAPVSGGQRGPTAGHRWPW